MFARNDIIIVGTQNLVRQRVHPIARATVDRTNGDDWNTTVLQQHLATVDKFAAQARRFRVGDPLLSGRRPMTKMTVIAATACALLGSAPLLSVMTTPSFAQGWRDSDDEASDRGMRGAFLERLQIRRDLRDLLEDRVRSRQDTRDLLSDLLRDRLRERLADRRDRDEDGDDGLRGRLRERFADRRDRDDDSDGGLRGRLRERLADSRDSDEDSGGGLRGRLRERLAERLRGHDSGDCYIFTRSLRDQDGDCLIIVRRRICRD